MYQILEKRSLNPTVTLLRIHAPLVARKAEAGQFINLRCPAYGNRRRCQRKKWVIEFVAVKGGESNAKTHLVLTPVVFVLAVEHRHFCLIRGKKQQIPRREKAYRRLFRAGASSMTQPPSSIIVYQSLGRNNSFATFLLTPQAQKKS